MDCIDPNLIPETFTHCSANFLGAVPTAEIPDPSCSGYKLICHKPMQVALFFLTTAASVKVESQSSIACDRDANFSRGGAHCRNP